MNFSISPENQSMQQPPQNLREANEFASFHITNLKKPILVKRIFKIEDRKQKVKLLLLHWMLFPQTGYFFHNVLLWLKLKKKGPKLLFFDCPVLNLYIQIGKLEMGFYALQVVKQSEFLCILHLRTGVWMTIRQNQMGILPFFILLCGELHSQYLILLCTFSVKYTQSTVCCCCLTPCEVDFPVC